MTLVKKTWQRITGSKEHKAQFGVAEKTTASTHSPLHDYKYKTLKIGGSIVFRRGDEY